LLLQVVDQAVTLNPKGAVAAQVAYSPELDMQ
jgi:hypothetical protein